MASSAADLMAGALKMVGILSPFVLAYLSIVYASEIIGLLRYAAAPGGPLRRRGRY